MSASGRFVRRDVTPDNLVVKADTRSVFSVGSVSASGIVAANVYEGKNSSYSTSQFPVVIDLNQRTFTRVTYGGPDASEALQYGQSTATNAQGDVYGTFTLAKDADAASIIPQAAPAYSFTYSRATGKATVRPYTFAVNGTLSNEGEALVYDRVTNIGTTFTTAVTSIVHYDSPQNKRPFVSSVIGDSRGYYINAGGTTVGVLGNDPLFSSNDIFLLKDGAPIHLPNLYKYTGRPLALSDDDRVVAIQGGAFGDRHIVTWRSGQPTELPPPPVSFDSAAVLGTNTRGEILFDVTKVAAPAASDGASSDRSSDRSSDGSNGSATRTSQQMSQQAYLLWRDSAGAWLDVTADVTEGNAYAVGLLADGRIVAASNTKIYTFTPR